MGNICQKMAEQMPEGVLRFCILLAAMRTIPLLHNCTAIETGFVLAQMMATHDYKSEIPLIFKIIVKTNPKSKFRNQPYPLILSSRSLNFPASSSVRLFCRKSFALNSLSILFNIPRPVSLMRISTALRSFVLVQRETKPF